MDRAWIQRLTFRRLLLAAVVIQATTPDLLDLSLLAQSLPPGPLFVASSLSSSGKSTRTPRFLVERDAFIYADAPPSEFAVENEPAESLCVPIWPEWGLRQDRTGCVSTRLKHAVGLPSAQLGRLEARRRAEHPSGAEKAISRPRLLLRLIC
jgi:hypothetical protein